MLDLPDERIARENAARRDVGGVDVGDQRTARFRESGEPRRKGHPVVGMDDVEALLAGDDAGHGGEPADRVSPVFSERSRGPAVAHEACVDRDQPKPPRALDRFRALRPTPGQKENDLAVERQEASGEAFAGEPARRKPREPAADHQDAHRGPRLRRPGSGQRAVTTTWSRRFSCQQPSV